MVNINVDVEDALIVTEKLEDAKDNIYMTRRFSVTIIESRTIFVPLI